MEKQKLISEIEEAIKENSDVDQIDEQSSFMDDLEMSSMEIYAFIGDLEAKLHIKIPQRVLNRASTVGELADAIIGIL